MKNYLGLAFCILLSGCATAHNAQRTTPTGSSTRLEVVELKDYRFKADSFFDERKDLTFQEVSANPKYMQWATEAIDRVNQLVSPDDRVPQVHLKLIFNAEVESKNGKISHIPISIIESYQEPKTNSIRLGMEELKDSKKSFQLTVAHEYAHLVFENASRRSGKTAAEDETIGFWPKSAYEGLADLVMAMAMESHFTAEPGNWAARDLFQYDSLKASLAAKDDSVSRARSAFKKMDLVPKYKIYDDWLARVGKYIKANGGTDPYAEGSWLAGSLLKDAKTEAKKKELVSDLIEYARLGKSVNDLQAFHDDLLRRL